MNSNKLSFRKILIFFFFFLLVLLTTFSLKFTDTDPLAVLSFYVNGAFFVGMILRSLKEKPFSIELIVWCFMFFFMFYAPLIQYARNAFPWRGRLSHDDILLCNVLLFVFSLFVCLGKKLYYFFVPKNKKQDDEKEKSGFVVSPLVFSRPIAILSLIISVLLAVYFLSQNGINGIIVSRAEATNPFYKGTNSAIALIADSFIPAFLAYGAAVAGQRWKNEKKGFAVFLIQFACLVICCFPTSIPRYKMACIYAPMAMILFPALKKKTYFFWAFVLSVFFILPVFSDIRYTFDIQSAVSSLSDNFIGTYTEVDYDAYRMLAGTIHYVSRFGSAVGKQLLGTFLFFVPRSIWPDKPGGSGSTVIRGLLNDDAFSNVSCPFMAEGYINFGIFGLILFALVLGYIVKKYDLRYWTIAKEKGTQFSPYLYLVMLFFFMLRGDLLSSFAYIVGFMATGYIMKLGSKLFESKKG